MFTPSLKNSAAARNVVARLVSHIHCFSLVLPCFCLPHIIHGGFVGSTLGDGGLRALTSALSLLDGFALESGSASSFCSSYSRASFFLCFLSNVFFSVYDL